MIILIELSSRIFKQETFIISRSFCKCYNLLVLGVHHLIVVIVLQRPALWSRDPRWGRSLRGTCDRVLSLEEHLFILTVRCAFDLTSRVFPRDQFLVPIGRWQSLSLAVANYWWGSLLTIERDVVGRRSFVVKVPIRVVLRGWQPFLSSFNRLIEIDCRIFLLGVRWVYLSWVVISL